MHKLNKHILIACGGTGGHVFPGIATGQILQQRGHAPALCSPAAASRTM